MSATVWRADSSIQTHLGKLRARNEDLEHLIHALGGLKPLQFLYVGGITVLACREEGARCERLEESRNTAEN